MAPRTAFARIDVDAAGDESRHELWRFVTRYEDIAFEDFEAVLRELSDVYVCRHASGAIGGVVAAKIVTLREEGRAWTMVWGEWGFLDPHFRGRLLLERAVLRSLLREFVRHPLTPVVFMAEAATWKGYLALARGFAGLCPRPGHPLTDEERRRVQRLGERDFDPAQGVFHRGKPIRAGGEELDAGRPKSRGVRALVEFYARANPGQAGGDTLLCVAPVSFWTLAMMPLRTLVAQLATRWSLTFVRPRVLPWR